MSLVFTGQFIFLYQTSASKPIMSDSTQISHPFGSLPLFTSEGSILHTSSSTYGQAIVYSVVATNTRYVLEFNERQIFTTVKGPFTTVEEANKYAYFHLIQTYRRHESYRPRYYLQHIHDDPPTGVDYSS